MWQAEAAHGIGIVCKQHCHNLHRRTDLIFRCVQAAAGMLQFLLSRACAWAGTSLTWPDYIGNNFFNTLGNILANGQAALMFIDFVSGDLLHLQGGRLAAVYHKDS